MDFKDFNRIPVIDCHVHFTDIKKIDLMLNIVSEADFHRASIVCTINRDKINFNPETLVLKALHPELFFIFGGLDYFSLLKGGSRPTILKQVDSLSKIGFDGVKMVEGKPTVRKLLNIRFDSEVYEGYFKCLEETGFPLLFHVADPEEFWDPQKVPSWAKQHGWFYDSTFPSKQQLYEEVGNVLDRHSGLRVVFAHFYFLSADMEAASRFLENYRNVHLDLTPGIEMYYDFSAKRDHWRDFFMKYQDRILFGTDISSENSVEEATARAWIVRKFLETDSEFYPPSQSDSLLEGPRTPFMGLNLSRGALEKIYCENFRKLAGFRPRKLDLELATEECDRLAEEEATLKSKPVRETTAAYAATYLRRIREQFD